MGKSQSERSVDGRVDCVRVAKAAQSAFAVTIVLDQSDNMLQFKMGFSESRYGLPEPRCAIK